jgi:hypothetical protein
MKISNPKSQIPKTLQAPRFQITKRRNPDSHWYLEIWNLFGIWDLGFGFSIGT